MSRSCKIAHSLLLLAGALGLGSARPALAQEAQPPDGAARIFACGAALDRVTESAEVAEWQAADAAYNQAVDVMDAARADLEPSLGPAASAPFALAYARLGDLDVALRSEDAVRVRSLVAEIKLALASLGAGGLGGVTTATAQVAAWQQALQEIAGHRDAGRWIAMRNGALALHDAMQAQGAGLAAATGAEGERSLAVVRVFAMRLFVAALDQDKAAGEVATAHASRALLRLLELLGAVRVTATPSASADLPRLRAYLASPGSDGVVTMPIKAENLPSGGLGSFRLEARWSPAQLQLVDLQWALGRGQTDRDDAAGILRLSLPQAPTGPSDPTVVATLVFALRSREFDPRDYLPQGSSEALRAHLEAARRALRLGDLAAVGRELTGSYLLLAPGAGADAGASIGDALAQAGQPDGLSPVVLGMVERVTEPSLRSEAQVVTDVLLEEIDRLEAAVDAALAAYGTALRGESGDSLPVLIRVLEMTDTSGAALSPVLGVNGQVLLDAAVDPTATPRPTSRATGAAGPTGAAPSAAAPAGPAGGSGASGGGTVVIVIAGVVLALALAGAWAAGRRAPEDGSAEA